MAAGNKSWTRSWDNVQPTITKEEKALRFKFGQGIWTSILLISKMF